MATTAAAAAATIATTAPAVRLISADDDDGDDDGGDDDAFRLISHFFSSSKNSCQKHLLCLLCLLCLLHFQAETGDSNFFCFSKREPRAEAAAKREQLEETDASHKGKVQVVAADADDILERL